MGQALAPFEQRTDRIRLLLFVGRLVTVLALACGARLRHQRSCRACSSHS